MLPIPKAEIVTSGLTDVSNYGRIIRLTEPYPYEDITASKGFISDQASIPQLLWSFFPPFGEYMPATVIHDFIHVTGIVPKKENDRIFLEMMKKSDVGKFKRYLIYSGARFGGPNYKREQVFEMIKKHEGLRLHKYTCPGGTLTIGYGHTTNAKNINLSTKRDAENLLAADIAKVVILLKGTLPSDVALTKYQFNALISFVFNIGIGAFRKSTMLKLIKQNKLEDASEQFERWIYGGNKVLRGLVKRRKNEKAMFLK